MGYPCPGESGERCVLLGPGEKGTASCILMDGGGDQAMLGKETSEASGLTGL